VATILGVRSVNHVTRDGFWLSKVIFQNTQFNI